MEIKINEKLVLQISDLLDDLCMLYFDATRNEKFESSEVTNYKVQKLHLHYYDCLIKILNVFMNQDNLEDIPENFEKQINEKLKELSSIFENNEINSEELRKALFFLDIKAFKNLHYPIDYITPDAVSYIAYLIASYIIDKKELIYLLDINMGTGNLAFTLANYLDNEVHLIGIDNHELLSQICVLKANFFEQELEMHVGDCLKLVPHEIDLIVSDLATHDYDDPTYHSYLYDKGIKYFPYLAVERYLDLPNKCKMIYLIDNDFFSKPGNLEFKKVIEQKGNILALITMPESFFQNSKQAKSLIIIDNDKHNLSNHTEIFTLPNLNDQTNFKQVMQNIKNLFN